jgi:hypothetical protein
LLQSSSSVVSISPCCLARNIGVSPQRLDAAKWPLEETGGWFTAFYMTGDYDPRKPPHRFLSERLTIQNKVKLKVTATVVWSWIGNLLLNASNHDAITGRSDAC